VVIFAVIAITFQSASLIQSGYDLVQLKGQAAQLEKNNELLRLDIAKLKSPERIQQIATDQLGLVQSKNTYYGTKNTTETTDKGGVQLAQKKSLLSKAEASKAH
jgi:cell division protein FtsL